MNRAVIAPITSTKLSAISECSNSGDIRATMKMPAVTMVAAWMRAEIGVGPSIESGSHTCSGNCADLPIAPMNRQMQATASTGHSAPQGPGMVVSANPAAAANTASYCSEPVYMNRHAMPSRNPRSPTRLTRKAFRLARIADSRSNQNPISR